MVGSKTWAWAQKCHNSNEDLETADRDTDD